jgi:2-polyprenyl-6-methoxyphenol hydroxylase-like FAD-dependent oxidoreductase
VHWVTSRTLEVWDDMGIARDMIDAGIWIDRARSIVNGKSTDLTVDLSDLPFAMLGRPQNDTERLLTRHLSRFGIEIERGMSREGLTQADGRVRTVLFGGAGGREEASFR